ncbi:18622_t:CDS:2, partial [Funneliformis geosporum]
EVESKGICKGTHKLTYGTWQERQEAEIAKVEEIKESQEPDHIQHLENQLKKEVFRLVPSVPKPKEKAMNKTEHQKELLKKIQPGVKPSDLKKTRAKPKPKEVLPPPISIDEGYGSDNAPLKPSKPERIPSIPTPPPLPNNQLALQKQIELHREIKKADEKKKQELAEKVKKLETKLQTLIKLAGEEKKEYEKTIEALKKPAKNPTNTPPTPKTPKEYFFTCDICQQNKKSQLHLAQVNGLGIDPHRQNKICATCEDMLSDTYGRAQLLKQQQKQLKAIEREETAGRRVVNEDEEWKLICQGEHKTPTQQNYYLECITRYNERKKREKAPVGSLTALGIEKQKELAEGLIEA